MKARACILLLVGLLVAGAAPGASPGQQPETQEKEDALITSLRTTRELADTAYCKSLPPHFMGRLLADDEGQIRLHPTTGWEYARRPATKATANRALAQYRDLLKEMLELKEEHLGAPIDLLCGSWSTDVTSRAVAPPLLRNKPYIAEEYGKRPSTLLAIVELEAALVEERLGRVDEYRKLLADAVERLDLEVFDFRSDVVFRMRMPDWLNFVRPEVCLVFLHATELRNQGKSQQALTLFKTIVEHAPCSPLAWLALAEVKALDATGRDAAAGLDLLTDFYPVFWGCTHLSLDSISRYTFKRRGSEILKLVSELSEPEE